MKKASVRLSLWIFAIVTVFFMGFFCVTVKADSDYPSMQGGSEVYPSMQGGSEVYPSMQGIAEIWPSMQQGTDITGASVTPVGQSITNLEASLVTGVSSEDLLFIQEWDVTANEYPLTVTFRVAGTKNLTLYVLSDNENGWSKVDYGAGPTMFVTFSRDTHAAVYVVASPLPENSIQVKPVTITEGAYGRINWNPEKTDYYVTYDLNSIADITITYNGKEYTGKPYQLSQTLAGVTGSYDRFEFITDQSYDYPWLPNQTYEATVSWHGLTDTFEVTINESPFTSMTVEDISLIKGADGYNYEGFDSDWNPVSFYRYSYSPTVTMITKSGEELIGTGSVDYLNEIFPVLTLDEQEINHWDYGTHQVTVFCGGVAKQINVNVTESPVESIQMDPIKVYEGISSSLNRFTPFTVTFKDGTTQTCERSVFHYNGKDYDFKIEPGTSSEEWESGKSYSVTASVLGFSTEVPIVVYGLNSIEMQEDNGLTLLLHQTNGETVAANVQYFDRLGGYAEVDSTGYLVTDQGSFQITVHNYDSAQNVSISIGELESNVLPSSKWWETNRRAMKTWMMFGDFDGIVNQDNIDYLLVDTVRYFNSNELPTTGESLTYDVNIIKEKMNDLFVIKADFDMSLSRYFNPERQTIEFGTLGLGGKTPQFQILSTDTEQGFKRLAATGSENDSFLLFDDTYRIRKMGLGTSWDDYPSAQGTADVWPSAQQGIDISGATYAVKPVIKTINDATASSVSGVSAKDLMFIQEWNVTSDTYPLTVSFYVAGAQDMTLYVFSDDENGWTKVDKGAGSTLLVTFTHDTHAAVYVGPSLLTDFQIADMEIVAGTCGYWGLDSNDEKCYMYNPENNKDFKATIVYDGKEYILNDPYNIPASFGFLYIDSYLDQYTKPWEPGKTYTVKAYLAGKECSFHVTIRENKLSSVKIEDIRILEKTNGYLTYDVVPGGNNSSEYYRYFPMGDVLTIKLVYDDETIIGNEATIVQFLQEECGEASFYNSWEPQSYDLPWLPGNTYEVNYSLLDKEGTYHVTIEKAVEPVSINPLNGTDVRLFAGYLHSRNLIGINYAPENADVETEWIVEDSNIVTVKNDGRYFTRPTIYTGSPGQTMITARSTADPDLAVTFRVTVVNEEPPVGTYTTTVNIGPKVLINNAPYIDPNNSNENPGQYAVKVDSEYVLELKYSSDTCVPANFDLEKVLTLFDVTPIGGMGGPGDDTVMRRTRYLLTAKQVGTETVRFGNDYSLIFVVTEDDSADSYTVTWMDEDETVLEVDEKVLVNSLPTYDGATPTKAADAQYTYTFAGWDPEISEVTANATYKATYSKTVNKYTVTFIDEDGTVLKEAAEYPYGTQAADIVKPEDPSKEADAQYTYTFAGWVPEVSAVNANVTYRAKYTATLNTYTITWKNEDGSVLQAGEVVYGVIPTYIGQHPAKEGTDITEFVFDKWNPAVVPVNGNAVYTASFIERQISFPDVASDYTGLAKSVKGDWYYLKNGKINLSYNGIVNNSAGWWKVTDGKVDFEFEGIANNEYGWWYLSGGKVDFSYTGFAENENGWWYVESGQIMFKKNDLLHGIANNATGKNGEDGWWLVEGSKVTDKTTVAQNAYGWWKVTDGKVDFEFTGLADNDYGWWYLEDGKVNFSYTGFAENEYGWWYVENGQITFKKNDILSGKGRDGWWLIEKSKVSDKTTVAKNANGWWRVEDGKVNFEFEGIAENDNGWWYLREGHVDFTYTGFAENEYGWWYVENGQITFKKNDIISGKGKEGWWLVEESKVTAGPTVAQNAYGWWYIDGDGQVDFDHNDIGYNEYGGWYIKNGQVDFKFTGPAYGHTFKDGKAVD